MITKKKRLRFLVMLSATAIIMSGCLLAATFLLEILVPGPFRYAFTGAVNGSFDAAAVDITNEADWQDNKDDISRIESIRFGGFVTNNSGENDFVSMFISQTLYATPEELQAGIEASEAIAMMTGMPIPSDAADLELTAAITDRYRVSNPDDIKKIKDIIVFGQFFTYAMGANANFDLLFYNCIYYIAFSASK